MESDLFDENLSEALRTCVAIKLIEFLNDDFSERLDFPSSLNSKERAYVKMRCKELHGLYTKSRFLGTQRYVTVYKKQRSTAIRKDSFLSLNWKVQNRIEDLLKNFPVTKKERDINDLNGCAASLQYDYLIGTPKVPKTEPSSTLSDFKVRLPVYQHLQAISKKISASQVTLILGDPGTGKSSQIPQFIMDECKTIGKACYIVCVQPSRLAAVSIAQRVATERSEDVGNSIGYESKLERVRNDKTLITYCTTDVLLRVLMKGKNALHNITHIFLDEVQERDKYIDVLLIALKLNLNQYPYLHLVLMAARVDHTDLMRFFDNTTVHIIDSHYFDVKRFHLDDVHAMLQEQNASNKNAFGPWAQAFVGNMINCELVLNLVKFLLVRLPKGSILLFVSSFEDIINLNLAFHSCDMDKSTYKVYSIHDDVQSIDHSDLLSETQDVWKIILSTGFAETSISIYDAVCVIDLGVIQCSVYDPIATSLLQHVLISKDRMESRALRAGRTRPGNYFILQNKDVLETMPRKSIPEICQAPITDICLIVKCLAPDMSILEYLGKAVKPPELATIQNSASLLTNIEAFDLFEQLTDVGRILLNFSVEPRLGKMLFYACIYKCLDPVLTIVCCLSHNNIFQSSLSTTSRNDYINGLKKLSSKSFSDHMTILRAFQTWSKKKAEYSTDLNYDWFAINEAAMEHVVNIRIKLVAELRAIELIKPRSPGDMRDLNLNSEKWFMIKAAIFQGLYPNIAKVDKDGSLFLHSNMEACLTVHPFSTLLDKNVKMEDSLAKLPTEWIMFEKMINITSMRHIYCNTAITLMSVLLFGGPLKLASSAIQASFSDSDSESENGDEKMMKRASLTVDDWITVYFDSFDQAHCLFEMKQKVLALVMKKLRNPSFALQPNEDKVIETLVYILGEEETSARLVNPPKIGQRPHKSLTVLNRTMYEPCVGTFKCNSTAIKPLLFPRNGHLENHSQSIAIDNESRNPTQTSKYFLVMVPSLQNIEQLQRSGVLTIIYNSMKEILEAVSPNNKVLLFFCVRDFTLTFCGFGEFLQSPDTVNNIKWISHVKVANDGSVEFLKFMCKKYESLWNKDVSELTSQCGQYLERLLSNPIPKTNVGRAIQKRSHLL